MPKHICQAEWILNPATICSATATERLTLKKAFQPQVPGMPPPMTEMIFCKDHVDRAEFQLKAAGHEPTRFPA